MAEHHANDKSTPESSSSIDSEEEEEEAQQGAARSARRHQLKKGRACVRCRERKVRCDGQPTCRACIRHKVECVYKEHEKSRTRKLLSRIQALEERLSELRITRRPAVSSYQEPSADVDVPLNVDSADALANAESSGGEWWLQDQPLPPIQKRLFDIVSTDRSIVSFRVLANLTHVVESISGHRQGTPPLPALLNVLYLLGCNFSCDPALQALEPHYLSRARNLLATSMGDPSYHFLQWLQASVWLSFYLLRTCRFLEARHELAGTIQLIKSCGLHKIKSSIWKAQDDSASQYNHPHTLLGPPRDSLELGERISCFWTAYYCEMLAALVSGLPPDPELEAETETVWPRTFEEYQKGVYSTPDSSVSSLFGPEPPHPFDPPCGTSALLCKSTALLSRVSKFATSLKSASPQRPESNNEFQLYERVLTVFLERLPQGCGMEDPITASGLFLVKQMVMVAYIQLYNTFDAEMTMPLEHPELYDKRLRLARLSLTLHQDCKALGLFSPSTGAHLWFPVARVFAQHVRRLQSESSESIVSNAQEVEEAENDLASLLNAAAELYGHFPVFRIQLERIYAYVNGEDEELITFIDPSPLASNTLTAPH